MAQCHIAAANAVVLNSVEKHINCTCRLKQLANGNRPEIYFDDNVSHGTVFKTAYRCWAKRKIHMKYRWYAFRISLETIMII